MFRTVDNLAELPTELQILLSNDPAPKTSAETAEAFENRVVATIEREMATRRAGRTTVLVLKD
jgi:hypothetical protein